MGRQDRTLAILAALRGHWISGLVTDQISSPIRGILRKQKNPTQPHDVRRQKPSVALVTMTRHGDSVWAFNPCE
jgi:hypothetical protein